MTEPKSSASHGTIAVIDEDVWLVRKLSELLQRHGFRVLLLTSSSNALQLVDATCDVVLVGEKVRSPSARELAAAIRTKLAAKRPWLVLLGAADGTLEPELDEQIGATVGDEELLAALEAAVRARRAAHTTAAPMAIAG